MTKEEYLKMTSYASVEEAQRDLNTLHWLFPLTLGWILLYRLPFLISETVAALSVIASFALLIFFIWKCYDVIKKTRKASKAQLLFSIVLAPLSWIWFYPQLSEPLEIIVGTRMPPTTDLVSEQKAREEARKKGSRNAWKTIGWVALIVFVALVVSEFFR